MLAKLLNYSFDDKLNPGLYNEIKDFSGKNRKIEMEGRTRLFVALGKKDEISPSKLVKFITKNTGVRDSVIDQVGVYDNFSFITVPFKEAEIILNVFHKKSGNKKSLIVKAKKRKLVIKIRTSSLLLFAPFKTFIYKGFKNNGDRLYFFLALNVGGQKKTVPPFFWHAVSYGNMPLNLLQFFKKTAITAFF